MEKGNSKRFPEGQYRSPNSIRIPRRGPKFIGHNTGPELADSIAESKRETPLDYLLLKMPRGFQRFVEKYFAAKKNLK